MKYFTNTIHLLKNNLKRIVLSISALLILVSMGLTMIVSAISECPAEQVQQGPVCVSTTTSTSMATINYTCPSGQVISGSNCINTSTYTATPIYSCPSGTQSSGSNCVSVSSVISATITYSCSWYWASNCIFGNSFPYQPCPDRWTYVVNGNDPSVTWCEINLRGEEDTRSYIKAYRDGRYIWADTLSRYLSPDRRIAYSCPAGGTLSGSTCTTIGNTFPASISGYTCPSGGTLSGSTCTTTITTSATQYYTCPSGQSLSGNICTLTTMIYSCISGYYQSQIGQPLCTPCPSGQYQSQQGQTSCIQCPTGITITNPSSGANNVNQCIVDSDSNGLIDIKNITMFNNINNDLTGATYNDGTVNTNGGCPIISGNRKCRGYELWSNIDLNNTTNGNAGSDSGGSNWWSPWNWDW